MRVITENGNHHDVVNSTACENDEATNLELVRVTKKHSFLTRKQSISRQEKTMIPVLHLIAPDLYNNMIFFKMTQFLFRVITTMKP